MSCAASALTPVNQVQTQPDQLDLVLANPASVSLEVFRTILTTSNIQNRTWVKGENILHKLAEQTAAPPQMLSVAFDVFRSLTESLRKLVAVVIPVRSLQELVISYSSQDLFAALTAVDSTGSTALSIASSQTYLSSGPMDVNNPRAKKTLLLTEVAKYYANERAALTNN